jgi:hypothetical protein
MHAFQVGSIAILHQVELCAVQATDMDNNARFSVAEINHIEQVGQVTLETVVR